MLIQTLLYPQSFRPFDYLDWGRT